MSIITKKCNKCGEIKEINQFHTDSRTYDKKTSMCKSCRCTSQRGRNKNNTEKIKQHNKEYYLENKETILERSKKYHINNQDKRNSYSKKWRRDNPQRVKELSHISGERNKSKLRGYIKSFFSRHPGKATEYARNRRAKEMESGGKITLDEWISLCNQYGNRCLCCGRTDVKLTLDHVIPLKLGGRHSVENAQPLCKNCNSKKHLQTTDYRI